MKLVAGIPDPKEYRVDVKLDPRAVKPGNPVKMTFRVTDPGLAKSGDPVRADPRTFLSSLSHKSGPSLFRA
jgi:hypothetical protein